MGEEEEGTVEKRHAKQAKRLISFGEGRQTENILGVNVHNAPCGTAIVDTYNNNKKKRESCALLSTSCFQG